MNASRRRPAALRGLGLFLLFSLSQLAAAQPAAAPESRPLEPVLVTATRLAQPQSALLSDVRVIDAETIRSAGTMSLPELLRMHGGAEIAATGGPGQISSVFLRGTNANHVVLLVDGVRVNSATSGTNAFENLPLEQIERIEILRGPASSLYGADAIGGVIQVFTRQGERTEARVGVGSRHTREASVGVGRQLGATRFSAQAGYTESRAFSATNEASAFSFFPDDDPYRNRHANLALSHEWAPGQTLAARALQSVGTTRFDSGVDIDDVNRQRLSTFALESRNRLSANWQSLLRAARGSDDISIRGSFPSDFRTDSDQLTWQNDFAALGGALAAGLEWRREQVTSDTAYAEDERRIGSVFTSYSGATGAHALQASVRRDDDSQFGARNSGNLAYGLRLAPAWLLRAGVGSAFKAPSFNDLYYPLSFGFQGNPDLRPERAKSAELAARFEQTGLRAGLTVFRNRIRDLISVDSSFSTVVNVKRARIRGVTLDADADLGGWALRGEVTQQDAVDADTGKRLVRRARHHGSVGVSAPPGVWRYGADLAYSGARFDAASNAPASRMGGYALLNLHAGYALAREWNLSLRVDNATDKHYDVVQGYNTAGRGVFVALNYAAK